MKMLRLAFSAFAVFLFVVMMLMVFLTAHVAVILLGIPVLALFLAGAVGALLEEAGK